MIMNASTLGRVFVVDDEVVIAKTLAAILARKGFATTAFTNPQHALDAAFLNPPDLLISDVAMPQFSGIELAVRIRAQHPGCRVLLFSGQANTTNLLEDAGALDRDFLLLAKPIHPAELLRQIGEQNAAWIVAA
jgi:DNA-binding NtrC family response regulator